MTQWCKWCSLSFKYVNNCQDLLTLSERAWTRTTSNSTNGGVENMTDEKLSNKHVTVFCIITVSNSEDWRRKPSQDWWYRRTLEINLNINVMAQDKNLSSVTHPCLPASLASIVPEGSDTLEVPAWICHLKFKHRQKTMSCLVSFVNWYIHKNFLSIQYYIWRFSWLPPTLR